MSYSFKEMVDMLWVCGAADSNARKALRIYTEKISLTRHSHHTMFASIDRRLRETDALKCSRPDAER
jgi:RNase P/RNase MRP subunit p30